MGLLGGDPEAWFQSDAVDELEVTTIRELIKRREQFRADGKYAEADDIRDKLAAQGIVLEDGPDGTSWRRE